MSHREHVGALRLYRLTHISLRLQTCRLEYQVVDQNHAAFHNQRIACKRHELGDGPVVGVVPSQTHATYDGECPACRDPTRAEEDNQGFHKSNFPQASDHLHR